MKFASILACATLATSAVNAASIPETNAINLIEARVDNSPRAPDVVAPDHSLEKRKGGGGRGGGGISSGGSSGGGRTSSGSSSGGATRLGSGTPRAYGNGFYGGGASVPYTAGGRARGGSGIGPGPLLVGGAALAIMPGLWLFSVYPYYFNNPYRFYNRTQTNETFPNGVNTTLPVTCLCQEFSPCGCDENDNQDYINDLIGNGSYAALNKSLVTVADINGTRNLVLNGTLENGTTAPGGTDDESSAINLKVGKYAGYWVMATVVLTGVMM